VIGYDAFGSCTGLTSITIGNSVTLIGAWAFSVCTGLTEIYIKNPTPPSLGSSCLYDVDKTTCKLYVPKGSSSTYRLAWGFDNVIETDFTAINPINKENSTIKSIFNGIAIETKTATPVTVYNLSGQTVYQSVVAGKAEIHLPKGVYILRTGNQAVKFVK
jgi:hypothetical protein